MPRTMLIAIGGNALIQAGEPATAAAERAHVSSTCRAIADLIADGWRVILTHGNGPQVGAALLRSERASADAYPLPLDLCVASTQGEVGVLLQQALETHLRARGLERSIATVVTQVVVDGGDRAFARPTKPIGQFYSAEAIAARRDRGWTIVEEPPHGWRRVVPSPEPLRVVEEPAIRALVDANVIVITLGGGGVPVVQGSRGLAGVEAVVDKDLASSLLATRLRLDRFVLATDVEGIYLDFATPRARRLDEVTSDDLRRYAALGQFPAGTMGPKVEAALRFVEAGGSDAIVTSYDRLNLALQGRAGTRVLAAAHAAP